MYFRTLFLGYFAEFDSERGMAWWIEDSLSLRSFLGLTLADSPDEPEILKSPAMNRRIVTWNPSGAQNPSARYAFAYFAVTLEQIQAHALETGQGR